MRKKATMPGPELRARLAAAIRAEDGAMRHDRMLLVAGGVILGAFVLLSWPAEAPAPATDTVADGAAAEAPMRVVSSGATRAPEPTILTGRDARGGYVSPDHPDLQMSRPDNEEALLEAMTDAARAAEAAAAAEALAAAAEAGTGTEAGSGTGDGAATEAAAEAPGGGN